MSIKRDSGFNSVRKLVQAVLRLVHEQKVLPAQLREELKKKAYQAEANVVRQEGKYYRLGYVAVNPEPHVLTPVSEIKDSVEEVKAIWPKGMHPSWVIIPILIDSKYVPWMKKGESGTSEKKSQTE